MRALLFAALLAPLAAAAPQEEVERPPNVVVVVSDDAGYADFSMHGAEGFPTPHIDSIAASGVRFTNGYVSASVCSPSRAGLMTGRYQQRFGHEFNVPPKYSETNGLPVEESTFADLMKAAGYRTIGIGKWHLGYAPHFHPLSRGFDDFYGFLKGSRSYWPGKNGKGKGLGKLLRDRDAIPEEFEYLTDDLGEKAAAYVDEHADGPFFLYVAFTAVHGPLHAKEEVLAEVEGFEGEAKRRKLSAMTRSLDDAVGTLLDALQRNGIEDDTLLVFVNDNGGQTNNGASNAPLRGKKGQPYEGGLRVPFVAQWPARWPKGAVYDEPVCAIDLLPTALAAAGADPPTDRPLDGVDLTPFVTGEAEGAPHEALYWRKGDSWAIREGPWKLARYKKGEPELYHLGDDLGETRDLADEERDKVVELRRLHRAWEEGLVEPRWTSTSGSVPDKTSTVVEGPPNIVLMMADDLGWGDVGFNGGEVIGTPSLDAMAANGLRFSRFYSAAPVCSPTRGSCLTGRHPYRYGVTGANKGHLRDGEISLAEILKERGYATGHFGKWHLGTLSPTYSGKRNRRPEENYMTPSMSGFDTWFSTEFAVSTWDPYDPANSHLAKNVPKDPRALYWHDGANVVSGPVGDDSRIIMDRAIPFVRGAVERDEPFFAVIWFHAPHAPVVGGPEYLAMYEEHDEEARHYYACVRALDDQVGRLREELRDLGVADDTMIWFCSDNGPEGNAPGGRNMGSAGPFRGRKRSLYEGGIRVPGLLEWPARVAAGRSTDLPVVTSDILPTVLEVLGASQPDERPLDGLSILDVLDGEVEERGAPVFFQVPGRRGSGGTRGSPGKAVIEDRYKLLTDLEPDGEGDLLYDLLADPAESENLAEEEPERVAAMRAALEAWRGSCAASAEGADYGGD